MIESDHQRKIYIQYAALPFRQGPHGETEVLLVTSRGGRRWIIPKGWPINGTKPHGTARREALEEAGLVGRISKRSLESFRYRKRLRKGRLVTCEVYVFALDVEQQYRRWREKDEREVRWFSIDAAASTVEEPELRQLIAEFRGLDA